MCYEENVVNITNVYLGFSYYCLGYFVFDVGLVEIVGLRGDPIEIPSVCVCVYIYIFIYIAGGIIEWDFCGTGKEEFFDDFWLYR